MIKIEDKYAEYLCWDTADGTSKNSVIISAYSPTGAAEAFVEDFGEEEDMVVAVKEGKKAIRKFEVSVNLEPVFFAREVKKKKKKKR